MTLQISYPLGAALVVGIGNVGGATARRLAQAGLPVAFNYASRRDRAAQLQADIEAAGGVAAPYQLDLTDDAAVTRIVGAVTARFGRLHTVVYAAGPAIPFLTVREASPAILQSHLQADTLGCYRLFRSAIPHLMAGGGGSLTAFVTMASHRAIDTDGLSAIPKAAVEALVRQIAAEEAPNGIRANLIPIGWVGGFASSFEDARKYTAAIPGKDGEVTRALIERLIGFIRSGRPGRAEEAADIVAYLASEQAAYVTGQSIPVDGGALL